MCLTTRRGILATLFAVATTIIACSDRSPGGSAPSPVTSGPDAVSSESGTTTTLAAPGVPGTYELSFWQSTSNGLVSVSTLPAGGPELILKATVKNSAGQPAQKGSVTFQYCSFRGLPPNDITRADEAPSAACAAGTATWNRLLRIPVDASGSALMDFGVVMIPRTVGFRFAYTPQGGAIASHTSDPVDFTWF